MTSSSGARSKGFSLIEAIIAIAVATIGMFIVMQMTNQGMRAQKGVETTADLNQLGTVLQQFFGPKDSCEMQLAGKVAGMPAITFDPTLLDPNGTQGRTHLQATSGTNQLKLHWPGAVSGGAFTKGPEFLIAPPGSPPSPDHPYYHFGGWDLNPAAPTDANQLPGLGIRVLSPASVSANTYLIRIEANLTKKTVNGVAISPGSSTGQRGSYQTIVSTTGTGSSRTITGCGQPASASLACRVVRGTVGSPVHYNVAYCAADETRTGGGCVHSSSYYLWNSFPVKSAAGVQGWICQHGTSNQTTYAYAVCCNGADTATLPDQARPDSFIGVGQALP